MQDSGGSKAIKVQPEELTFDQLIPNVEQTQELVFRNNLSAPVEISLKSSNAERIQIEPKHKRLAPFESFTAEVTVKITKQGNTHKAPKFKELIKIQSDFFDQKVNVTLIPSTSDIAKSRDNSLQASIRLTNKASLNRDKSPRPGSAERDYQKESDSKDVLISDLQGQLKVAEDEIRHVLTMLEEEQEKVKQCEANHSSSSDEYSEYISQVKLLLREREPSLEKLIEITMQKEREAQQYKDAKVLEFLKSKDQQIEELQSKCESLESEYGNVSQSLQERVRQIKQLQENEVALNDTLSQLNKRYESALVKLDSFEKGKEYRRLIESEERLIELTSYNDQLQKEFTQVQTQLQQKESLELYFEEVMKRYKDQMLERDTQIDHLKAACDVEKEKRIRVEEQFKNLSDNDSTDRARHLQGEKSSLLDAIEKLKSERFAVDEQLRGIVNRISDIHQPVLSGGSLPLVETLEKKVQGLILYTQEKRDQNDELGGYNKELKGKLDIKEQELSALLSDNKKLSLQIHEMLSKKTLSRPVQTDIEADDMEVSESMKSKYGSLEEQCDQLLQQSKHKDRKLVQLENELTNKNQEVQMLLRSSQDGSVSQHQLSSDGTVHHRSSSEEAISRLNARISQLKMNEDILLKELAKAKQPSDHMQEAIIFEQGEKLILLEEENASLRRHLKEASEQSNNQNEQAQIRLKNLQEIIKKHEMFVSASQKQDQFQQKPADLERMRQALQQAELSNLNLKHQIDELYENLQRSTKEARSNKEELRAVESELIGLRQDSKLNRAGFLQSYSSEDPRNVSKINEQSQMIQQLQGMLTQAKQVQAEGVQPESTKFEQFSKFSEKLKKEHHQALMAVIDIKEEFSSKLLSQGVQHEQVRFQLLKENGELSRKLGSCQVQMGYMEKKEIRLHGQVEELKELHSKNQQELEQRTKELEDLLLKKESSIDDLEREISAKDKTLMERQEQISVLINTLEGEHSRDEMRQRVLNLSAELCSVKAIESQQARKVNDLTHHLKKVELQASKNEKSLKQMKVSCSEMQQKNEKLESEYSIVERRLHDVQMHLDDREREATDLKYQVEKQDFQLKIKEENLVQARESLKRSEVLFKEEVERLRKEFYDQISKEYKQQKVDNSSNFKAALSQLHIILSECPDDKSLSDEFEKALSVASSTIEKLQSELDRTQYISARFKQDLKATVLNQVLLSRQEHLQSQYQQLQIAVSQREEERASYFIDQELSYKKVIREQDIKVSHIEREARNSEDENQIITEELRAARDQKDELEQNLILFGQEIESKRFANEKRAELSVDERFKSKHESIKCYFDSQLTRIMLQQSGGNEKALEMGREILALKLLVQKLESTIILEQSEAQALDLSLAHYKEQNSQLEQRIRDLTSKNAKHNISVQQACTSSKLESEKRRQDMISVGKELIKVREALEAKNRDVITLQEQLDKTNQICFSKQSEATLHIAEREHTNKTQSQQIQELQEKLMELRTTHIQELENMKVQYDLEISESKRHLAKEREVLEKRYMPGHAPGEIQEENQELTQRIQDLKQGLDQFMQENAIIRKKFDNERLLGETLRREVDSYKQALVELESTMIDMGAPQTYESHRERSGSRGRKSGTERKAKKPLSKNASKKITLHADDSSSLAMSTITQDQPAAKQSIFSQGRQFSMNPPAIVTALVQSKIQELSILKKYDDQLRIEVELRHCLKEAKLNEMHQFKEEETENQQRQRLLELEVENEDLKIQLAHEHVDQIQLKNTYMNSNDKTNYPASDYLVMIEALVFLATHIATLESGYTNNEGSESSKVEEAQRLVIHALASKAGDITNFHPPSEEQDRKLWYLELLESQVSASETVTLTLQNFIKKLQIDIQGNLQSAASIKAASMDLANNLKRTSDEIRLLRQSVGLAKHDLDKATMASHKPDKTINPFESVRGSLGGSAFNQMMSQQDAIQNQLTISEKVKKSLEEEIVSIKIAHKEELLTLNQRLTQAVDQRNSMLQVNEELHGRVDRLQASLEELRGESQRLQEEQSSTQSALLEKEREKQLLAANKSATSKHLQKLQQDMQDWRKQTDENFKNKEKQVEELQSQVTALSKEKERLKSENLMLRRVDKDRRTTDNEEVKRLQDENRDIQAQLDEQVQERKREVEYWVTERATMREMIEQLENGKVAGENGGVTVHPDCADDVVKQVKKRCQRKIKEKEAELKVKQKQIEDLKDEVHHLKQAETSADQHQRETTLSKQEIEERLKYAQHKLREVELERDLVLAERNNAISENDVSAQQIQAELNSLRECFAKLKVERDNLLFQFEDTSQREREWRLTVERLSAEVQKLEAQIGSRERDQGAQLRASENKSQTLLADLKYIREEQERLKEQLKAKEQQMLHGEQRVIAADMRAQEALYAQDELRRQLGEYKALVKQRADEMTDLHEQLCVMEAQKVREIEALGAKVEETKEANSQLAQLYENQIQDLKVRLMGDKKKTEVQADQIINLTQREAVIRQLKKELVTSRASFAKVKAKNKEMKLQLSVEKDNLSNYSVANSASTKHSTSRKALLKPSSCNSRYEEEGVDKSVIKLAQILLSGGEEKPKGVSLFENLQRFSKSATRIVELEADIEKQAAIHAMSKDQISDLRQANLDLSEQINDLSDRLCQLQRESKVANGQAVRSLTEQLDSAKSQLKQAHSDLQQLRQEWMPPSDAQAISDKLKETSSQVKSLKDELQRKKEVISQLKTQKQHYESEVKEVAADIEELKDDNAKMSRLIKDNAKQLGLVRDLKLANDQLRATERRLREELTTLSERLRIAKQDGQRKETLARELKERIDQVQEEATESRDRLGEVDRLKDVIKKLRLETEIKDNQVKQLRIKVDHFEGECELMKRSQREDASEQQHEQQLRTCKMKLKKAEGVAKKSLDALKKIGREIALTHINRKSVPVKPKEQSRQQEGDQQYYKDSVNILGMSIDELLDDFVAPGQNPSQNNKGQQLLSLLDKLGGALDESLGDTIEQVCQLCLKLIQ